MKDAGEILFKYLPVMLAQRLASGEIRIWQAKSYNYAIIIVSYNDILTLIVVESKALNFSCGMEYPHLVSWFHTSLLSL